VSSWQLRAPIEQVWAALNDLEHLPVWYRGVQEARELVPGDARGVGRRVRYVIKGRLPLRLAFEATTTRAHGPTVRNRFGFALVPLRGLLRADRRADPALAAHHPGHRRDAWEALAASSALAVP
jgi:hypothetical protein